MKSDRPGVLATRAVNQYRRRDAFTFLGLRYCVNTAAARRDRWIRDVAVELVTTRKEAGYFRALHFKEAEADGAVSHRSLHLPGACEALAEAALLDACAHHSEAFGTPARVFSYALPAASDRSGMFEPYVKGLKERQSAIAEAARGGGIVQCVDIRKFYPSISGDLAMTAWERACAEAGLHERFAALGKKLIGDHGRAGNQDGAGILTGPMLSHLLGNLVLREVDREHAGDRNVGYFRYVDDVTLVGPEQRVAEALGRLESSLARLGLELHPDGHDKRLAVPCEEWLKETTSGEVEQYGKVWAGLVGDLKRLLLLKPGNEERLRDGLRALDFRLPVTDYRALANEGSWIERFRDLISSEWFRDSTRALRADKLIEQALMVRDYCERALEEVMAEWPAASPFRRKCLVPRARYAAGRLIYLATRKSLWSHAGRLKLIPELHLHGHVMQAVATGEVDELLPLGANAAQAAAQAFAAGGHAAALSAMPRSEAGLQALAVLVANGVRVEGIELAEAGELLRLARVGCDAALMRSEDPFIRELACLHGLAGEAMHADQFVTAFDRDDDLVMDAIDQLHNYPSL